MRHLVAVLGAGSIALAGCGASTPAPTTNAGAPSGRAIGAGPQTEDQQVAAAAARFTDGLLAYQRGALRASSIPNADPLVLDQVDTGRIPPAQLTRRRTLNGVVPFAVGRDRAQATATIRNVDEGVVYSITLELARGSDGTWRVRGIADGSD